MFKDLIGKQFLYLEIVLVHNGCWEDGRWETGIFINQSNSDQTEVQLYYKDITVVPTGRQKSYQRHEKSGIPAEILFLGTAIP